MEAGNKANNHMTSASAFVEGGIQDTCDDSCSICLEYFSQSDPSTVTVCKHEFHLQCILEWCQRSSNCPMCWQSIKLKDATSQELLKAVEEERELRSNRSREAAIFHYPSLGDFNLQHTLHIPVDTNDLELEEHIFQHLAAAAAMQRRHHIFRREGQRNLLSTQGHSPFFILSAPNAPRDCNVLTSSNPDGEGESAAAPHGSNSISHPNGADAQVPAVSFPRLHTHQASVHSVGSNVASIDQRQSISGTSRSPQGSQETVEQPDLQSFSESIRSRLNTWSMRYKESFSRNTRGWKERLFARSPSIPEAGSEVQREVNAGFASISRTLGKLDIRGKDELRHASASSCSGSRCDTKHLEDHVS